MPVWKEKKPDEAALASLLEAGIEPLVARLMANRGISAADVAGYLNPSLSALAKPDSLPGVSNAVDILLDHVKSGREIVVFGDYDCDGISASAIAVTAISSIGGKVSAFIPRRMGEGYGMTEASVARMLAEHPGVSLVVTVDNGIGSVREIAALKARGISVVVTDHHLPGETLPDADALVNPKVASPHELENLCGAAVAFFVANSLVSRAKATGLYTGPSLGEPLLVLAGLATVTDVMPICGQNRILVSEALRRFQNPDVRLPGRARRGAPAGLRELLKKAAKTTRTTLAARDFGFMLGPRINAVGRLEGEFGTAMDALRLMLSTDPAECGELAAKIDNCNASRKNYEKYMTDEAMKQVDESLGAQVISFEANVRDVHPGVAGIVASRVLDKIEHKVPVCVLVDGKGSSRAPSGYNVRDALAACSDCLSHFGGHAAAAGLGVKDGFIDAFRNAFSEACSRQAEAIPPDELAAVRYDAEIPTSAVTLALGKSVATMEPFGEGNPEPVFMLRGAKLDDIRTLGKADQPDKKPPRHVSFMLSDSHGSLRAVWWYHGDEIESIREKASAPVDVLFGVSVSDYCGEHVELRIVDIRPSEA